MKIPHPTQWKTLLPLSLLTTPCSPNHAPNLTTVPTEAHSTCTLTLHQNQVCIDDLPPSSSADPTMRQSVRIATVLDATGRILIDNRLSPAVPLPGRVPKDGGSGFHDVARGPYVLKGKLGEQLVVASMPSPMAEDGLVFKYGGLMWMSSQEASAGQGGGRAGCVVERDWTKGGADLNCAGRGEKGNRDGSAKPREGDVGRNTNEERSWTFDGRNRMRTLKCSFTC